MSLFSRNKASGNSIVWRDSNGNIRCLGDDCPQKKCDDTCPIWKNTIAAELIRRGNLAKAIEVYEEAVKIAPDFYDAWNNMGAMHGQFGSYQRAHDCYLKAHELRQDKYQPVFGLALASRDLKLYEECLRWCDLYDTLNQDGRCDAARETAMKEKQKTVPQVSASDSGDEIVRYDEDEEIKCVKRGDKYYFLNEDDDEVCTPGGNEVSTIYKALADRIFDDLVAYGTDDMGAYSILPWHYTIIDNFAPMGKERVQQILEQSFLTKKDWTFAPDNKAWQEYFGTEESRVGEIKDWLSKCTVMQMTAACCIGNAYHSINMAYTMAKVMEEHIGEDRRTAMAAFSDCAAQGTEAAGFGSAFDIMQDFDTFELYYGIHLKEYGKIITQ